MARSILSGYDATQRANRAAANLDEQADAMIGARTSLISHPTRVHEKAVDILDDLMRLGLSNSDDETPLQMRVMLRTLTQVRPLLLETFAKVDPAQIVIFMRQLGSRIDEVVREGEQYLAALEPKPTAPAGEIPSPHDDADPAADPAAD